jgi:hypothetical protein
VVAKIVEDVFKAIMDISADRKTEPTISKMEQVEDEPQTETKTETQNSNLTFEKRTMRDCYNCKRYETEGECVERHYEPKDEPQTCEECEHWNDTEDGCADRHGCKIEPQTDCEDTSCPYFKNPDYSRCMRCEPQTDCAWGKYVND